MRVLGEASEWEEREAARLLALASVRNLPTSYNLFSLATTALTKTRLVVATLSRPRCESRLPHATSLVHFPIICLMGLTFDLVDHITLTAFLGAISHDKKWYPIPTRCQLCPSDQGTMALFID